MKKLILLLILCISLTSFACREKIGKSEPLKCNNNYSMDVLNTQLAELLATNPFKSLNDIDLRIKSLKSNAYFLATGVKGYLRRIPFRTYILKVNEDLFKCAPTEKAMKAILAHELTHILDYTTGNRFNMLSFGLKYITNGPKVEKGTDLRVLRLGYTNGIKEYRNWVYSKLTPRQLKIKRKRYITPEEVDGLVEAGIVTPLD